MEPTKDELNAAAAEAQAIGDAAVIELRKPRTSWFRQQLTNAEPVAPPIYLRREPDGQALIYPGRSHSFVGQSETLKTWAALLACKDVLTAGQGVLYIDFESARGSFAGRARVAGIPDGALDRKLVYVRPEDPFTEKAQNDLVEVLVDLDPRLIVLDGVTEAFALNGWDVNSATETALYHKMLLRRLTNHGLAATIEVDHTPHGTARSLGSQHKRAGIDGAQYLFTSQKKGGQHGRSEVRLTVEKDREGLVRDIASGKDVGTLVIDSDGPRIEMPSLGTSQRAIAEVIERVDDFLRSGWTNPKGKAPAVRDVRDNVEGGSTEVQSALDSLAREGRARSEKDGAALRWSAI